MVDVKNITDGPKVINAQPPITLQAGEERKDLTISRAEFQVAEASGWFELDGEPEDESTTAASIEDAVAAAREEVDKAVQARIDDLNGQHATELQAANDRADKAVSDLNIAHDQIADLQAQLEAANRPEPGPLDQSVDKLTAYLETVTDADAVQKLIDAETAGKSRATALAALQARLDAIRG